MDPRPGVTSGADRPCADGGDVLSAEAVEVLVEESVVHLVADPAPATALGLLDLLEHAGTRCQTMLVFPVASAC